MTRRGWRRGIAPLVLAALVLTGGAAARGDACSECGPPSRQDLEQQPGFALEERALGVLDQVHLHGGECRIQLTDAPQIQKLLSWLVLRGSGAVWNCPSSKASDTMTATVAASDRRSWSFSASASASASFLGVGLSAEVVAAVTEACEIKEVTSISKSLSANWCRVIAWEGYFEVAEYAADVTLAVERRFAWWTKNATTGDKVHRSGELWLACGVHTARLDARAPISGYFRLHQTPCPDPECKAIPRRELGFFPPLPPGLLPPVTPGDGEVEEAPEEDAPPEPDDREGERDDEDDAEGIPSSDELGDPPAGIPPIPPGFGSTPDEEPAP